jgi:signal transduction histidine kinase
MWLIIGLSVTFSVAAAVWVGGIARDNVVEQHARRLALETDQLSSDLSQAIAARLGAIRAAEQILGTSASTDPNERLISIFRELSTAYPQLDWLLVANTTGIVLSANAPHRSPSDVSTHPWFLAGLKAPWLGIVGSATEAQAQDNSTDTLGVTSLGDIATPVTDATGQTIGVMASHLHWQRSPKPTERLTDEPSPSVHTDASLLDRHGTVIVGTPDAVGRPWSGVPTSGRQSVVLTMGSSENARFDPHFERLPNGKRMLVARAPLNTGIDGEADWLVQLSEPNARVYQRANALASQILWVSIGLGIVTAMLGGVGAHQLTARLKRLAVSVAQVKRDQTVQIEIPRGIDEVAQLAAAFAELLGHLELERAELKTLSLELERRVAVRTSEVERLADESRYAAIVRERLKIARDLHDTLAHSMMAILSEIRFLRRLQTHNPAAVANELARAEEVAHEGLKEARTAITQMRVTAVRDTGLGPALSTIFDRFIDSTGLCGEFSTDPKAARFGDERAETLVRMTQEVLRNIERHAKATEVTMTLSDVDAHNLHLKIKDNGVGFDPTSDRAGHYGIVGLHEQAELIGARLEIFSKEGAGTTVSISLRVSPEAFGHNA